MVVLFLSSSFRRQACQSVRVCHGCGDPFSGLSGLNFELHLFAKFPEYPKKGDPRCNIFVGGEGPDILGILVNYVVKPYKTAIKGYTPLTRQLYPPKT